MADTIPVSKFTRHFGRYRMLAQHEAVAVSSHGLITGYFVAPDEYEEFRRFKQRRRSFAAAELSDERVQAIRPHAWMRGMRISMLCSSPPRATNRLTPPFWIEALRVQSDDPLTRRANQFGLAIVACPARFAKIFCFSEMQIRLYDLPS
jgi:hypothetical protein